MGLELLVPVLGIMTGIIVPIAVFAVSYTHLRAHET